MHIPSLTLILRLMYQAFNKNFMPHYGVCVCVNVFVCICVCMCACTICSVFMCMCLCIHASGDQRSILSVSLSIIFHLF